MDTNPNFAIEQRAEDFFGNEADARIGTGWWSGVIAVFCGALALGGVLCLHFPQLLSSPELRPYYPMVLIRGLIEAMIWGALGFALLAALLGRRWRLALTAFLLALTAAGLGGSAVPIDQKLTNGPAIGLDWFLLDLLAMSLIYVPIERIWPYYRDQGTFRPQWTLDVVYFLSTHLPIQILSFLVLLPATKATEYLAVPALAHAIAALPFVVQFFLAVVVADLAEWTIHYALHKVPFLWRFHSIHHSSEALDWLAGSRSHFLDDTLVRGFILVPMMLAFSQTVILVYLVFVTLHATWTHCNCRLNVKWLEPFLVMPRYHHWHHTSQQEAIDKNFAIHFPWIDRLFGTYYYPAHWPEAYGLDHELIPDSFVRQTYQPFFKRNRRSAE
jgi:sterol desaturase/sphingolipid hydroxylase (fatty acid hydroxylase superfamily)